MTFPAAAASTSAGPPDPRNLATRADFAAALTEARVRAGLTIREVSRSTSIPTATLGGYFSGRNLPQLTQWEAMRDLLVTLGLDEDLDAWREAFQRVRSGRAPRTGAVAAPYLGLRAFQVEDAARYFGREDLVTELTARVDALAHHDVGFLAVVGASGSGKSSLVRAGLLADLTARGLPWALCQPGAEPLAALEGALAQLPADTDEAVVVIDQFEEVFDNRVSDEERQQLVSRIDTAARAGGIVVVTVLRADFFDRCIADPLLLELARDRQLLVGAMGKDALGRAITEPARAAGCTVADELVEVILDDLARRDDRDSYEVAVLPLLSHVLLTAWERSARSALTVADYVAVGGVREAVQRTAEQTYDELSATQQTYVRDLFGLLVTVDEDGLATRRRISHRELPDTDDDSGVEAIGALVNARILTTTEHSLEVSHEILLTAWSRLRSWIDQNRNDLRLRRRISDAANVWEEDGRHESALLRGPLLEIAGRLAEPASAVRLTDADQQFLSLSRAQEQLGLDRERRRRRIMNALFAVAVVLAVVATVTAGYLVAASRSLSHERTTAETQRDQALSRQIAVQASKLAETDPALAAQLALAGYRVFPSVEARSALLDVTGQPLSTRLVGPAGATHADASPDGRAIATIGADGKVYLYATSATTAPTLVSSTTVSPSGLFAGAWSADGRRFAYGGATGLVGILDTTDPAHPRILAKASFDEKASTYDLAWSGRTLYAASSDAVVRRYAFDGRHLRSTGSTGGFDGPVQAVAVSPTGQVATGSADGAVRLWRQTPRGLVLTSTLRVGITSDYVFAVAFSPDGSHLAGASKDKTVRVWTTGANPRRVAQLTGAFSSWVNSVAFSHDGRLLTAGASGDLVQTWRTSDWSLVSAHATPSNVTRVGYTSDDGSLVAAGVDGITRIWPTTGPQPTPYADGIWSLTLAGRRLYVGVGAADPSMRVLDVRDPLALRAVGPTYTAPASAGVLDGAGGVSPDGKWLVDGTASGAITVWRIGTSPTDRPMVLPATTALVENTMFSRDGRHVVITSDDGSAAVYDMTGDRPRLQHRFTIKGLAIGASFSPDDSVLAVGGGDNLVHLYSLENDQELATIDGFDNAVYAVGFSPDGTRLATGGADRTVRLFDVSDPTHPSGIGTPLQGPTDTLFATTWSPDGTMLATPSSDGRLWLWQTTGTGAAAYASLDNLGAAVTQTAFSTDSGTVYAAGLSGRVGAWATTTDAAGALICRERGTPISEAEWSQFVPGATYADPCR
ncbi:MAG TPA: helix-turn-helix domain-containing protein [Nocardioides sp.]|nr:helix-turn-helix domain-containing protein [Nocardioides sp.]